MAWQTDRLDWDAGNRAKCQKHGVTLEQIEAVIFGQSNTFDDPAHSEQEPRYRVVGPLPTGRHVLVVVTFRKRGERVLVRPISARYMHEREIRDYEEAAAALEQR